MKYNIERYNSTGLAGYVVIGSTGESVLLSRSEMDSILATVKEAAGQGKRLIAGTGAESTAETIERTKRAAELGYHFALVKTPLLLQAGVQARRFDRPLPACRRCIADSRAALFGAHLYRRDARSAGSGALSEHPNIVGIKDSSGHVMRVGEMVARRGRTSRF